LLHFVQNGVIFPHRTKKSFSLQQGKQKSKKTTELAIEVAAYIRHFPTSESIRFECVEPGTVLFFDCEQGESYGARTMKLILKLADLETSESLKYFDLRELTPTTRLDIIEAAIKHVPNVKWVIIDGIVDVMNDFMSAEEGHSVITGFLVLCSKYDIHITGVLHQNKGLSKDARAHVGSIAGQKCEVEVMVERDTNDKEMSIVSAKESRGLPFDDFAIKWERGGLPYIVQVGLSEQQSPAARRTNSPANMEDHKLYTILTEAFSHSKNGSYEYKELVIQVDIACDTLKCPLGVNKVKEMITVCRNKKFLLQEKEEAPYSLGEYISPSAVPQSYEDDDDEPPF